MNNSALKMAKRSLEIEEKAVRDVLDKMDWQAFEKAAEALAHCDRIITSASGSSGIAAKKLAHTLCCIERPAQFMPPCEAMHGCLGAVQKGNAVVLDIYCSVPERMSQRAYRIKELLEKYGYNNAENICNEWNYVKGWTNEFVYSVEQHINVKGATFVLSCMSEAQKSPMDMLMYYDTRPSVYNGVFDFYTAKPLKGYYAFYWYGMLYDMQSEIRPENDVKDIYSLSGVDENGKILSIITHYSDDDNKENVNISVDFGRSGKYEIYLLDKEHNGDYIKTAEKLEFDMPVHSAVLIKEI